MASTPKHVIYFHRQRGIVKVKRGFSWPALLFGSLWGIAKRIWLPGLLLLVAVDVVLWFVTGYAEATGSLGLVLFGLVANIVYAVVRGKYGNRWLEASLARRGYVLEPAPHGDA